MASIDLNRLRVFVAVFETNSFSVAAERLGVPRSTVSRAITGLEDELAVRLFQRTTRKVAPTPAAIALHARVAPSLSSLEASLAELPEQAEAPSGTLRITASPDLATVALADVVARYTARYPAVTVDLHLTNRQVDLVAESFDLALRITSGPLKDSSLVARRIGHISIQLYASPAYLARHGTPRSPDEFEGHELIAYRGAQRFMLLGNLSSREVAASVRVYCDDMFFARESIRAGAGIGVLPSFIADGLVASGELVRVAPKWVEQTGFVYLVQPSARHVPQRVTAFREMLLETFRQRPIGAYRALSD